MYRWQRLLRDARDLRARRRIKLDGKAGVSQETKWLEDYEAARVLVADLQGSSDSDLENDSRRQGDDRVFNLALGDDFIRKAVEAVRSVMAAVNLDMQLENDAEGRLRALMLERRSQSISDEGHAAYVDRTLRVYRPAVRDAVVLARQALLLEIVRELILDEELHDAKILKAEPEITVVNGRLRRPRKPRDKRSKVSNGSSAKDAAQA
jgi:hypothetical protein